MKTFLLIFLILTTSSINSTKAQDLSQKKNYISVETGFIKAIIYDEYINFKTYEGSKYLPIRLFYYYQGKRFKHNLNFYMINLKLETGFNDTYFEFDYCNYSGGELLYRFFYNTINNENFVLSVGTGLLSTGTMRYYFRKQKNSFVKEEFHSNDITAASLMINTSLAYKYKNSFVLFGLDIPFLNYYQRPSKSNSIRLNNLNPENEWETGTFSDYLGFNFYSSIYQHLYRGVYITVSYDINFYNIQTYYPVKSLKYQLTTGITYNF